MVLVVSRFTVRAGLEEAVRAAFRDRPRLADHAPGFLGLEVFTDPADPATFHLATRWADAASFDAWHGSEAHRASHQYLPKGLKLVPGSTQVTRLGRLPGGDPARLEEVAADAAPVLAAFLATARSTHLLVAGTDGTVRLGNHAMAASLGLPEADLFGRPVWGLLTDADATLLRDRVGRADRRYEEPLLLNFVDAAHSPFTLDCRCDVQPGYFVLVGEPPAGPAGNAQADWLQMNNQMAVLARENARQAKELAQAKREVEQTLSDLRDTHWHLKKLQEVLPICMECGKVKSGTEWGSVVAYLKANALFLSHGYCPDCLARVAAEWGVPPGEVPT